MSVDEIVQGINILAQVNGMRGFYTENSLYLTSAPYRFNQEGAKKEANFGNHRVALTVLDRNYDQPKTVHGIPSQFVDGRYEEIELLFTNGGTRPQTKKMRVTYIRDPEKVDEMFLKGSLVKIGF